MSLPTNDTHNNKSQHYKKYVFISLMLLIVFIVYLFSKYSLNQLVNFLPYVNDEARGSSVLEESMEESLRKTYKYLALSEMYVGYSASEVNSDKLKLLLAEINSINDEYWTMIREINKKLMDYKTDISDNTFIYWGIINDDVSKQFEANIVASVANIAKKLNSTKTWGIINDDVSKQFEANIVASVANIAKKLNSTTTSGFANKLSTDSEYSTLLENAGIGAQDLASHLQYIKNNADAYKNVTAQLISTTDHIDNINPRLGLYAAVYQEKGRSYGSAPLHAEPSEYIKRS